MTDAQTVQLNRTIRGSRTYFVEVLFPSGTSPSSFQYSIDVSLEPLRKETSTYESRQPRLYTWTLSDYIIVRDAGFNGVQAPLFIESQELSKNRSRYLSMIGGAGQNFGTALAGSPSCVVEDLLPPSVNFKIGFLNPSSVADRVIRDPNVGGVIGGQTFDPQEILYILVRYSVTVNYL